MTFSWFNEDHNLATITIEHVNNTTSGNYTCLIDLISKDKKTSSYIQLFEFKYEKNSAINHLAHSGLIASIIIGNIFALIFNNKI